MDWIDLAQFTDTDEILCMWLCFLLFIISLFYFDRMRNYYLVKQICVVSNISFTSTVYTDFMLVIYSKFCNISNIILLYNNR